MENPEKKARVILGLVVFWVLVAVVLTYTRSVVHKDFYIILPEEGADSEQLE